MYFGNKLSYPPNKTCQIRSGHVVSNRPKQGDTYFPPWTIKGWRRWKLKYLTYDLFWYDGKNINFEIDTENLINVSATEIWDQWSNTNSAFTRRIAETIEIKNKLQLHLHKVSYYHLFFIIINIEQAIWTMVCYKIAFSLSLEQLSSFFFCTSFAAIQFIYWNFTHFIWLTQRPFLLMNALRSSKKSSTLRRHWKCWIRRSKTSFSQWK